MLLSPIWATEGVLFYIIYISGHEHNLIVTQENKYVTALSINNIRWIYFQFLPFFFFPHENCGQ